LPSLLSTLLSQEQNIKRKSSCQLTNAHPKEGEYLVFDRSNISLLSIVDGIWDSAFPLWDIESVITVGTRWGYFESRHLLNYFFTGLRQKRKRPGISREQKQIRHVGQELRLNLPCPPSDSWPIHMYGHQERPQDYGWKYASDFSPKLNAERFHPPKQNIVSTCIDCVQLYSFLFCFVFVVLRFALRAFTLSHSTSPIFL
jgi:hypothetical protein